MVTEQQVRSAWVRWQMAESRERNWSFAECMERREEYVTLRDQYEKQDND